jgi:hypothetical protein
MFLKSCNCNSSIATRVAFAVRPVPCCVQQLRLTVSQFIFALNSILAWVMKTDMAISLIKKWSFDYIKMECASQGGKCYGVIAVGISAL